MKRLLLAGFLLSFSLLASSQLLTWTPDFPKDNDNLTITVDATRGNQGLMGYTDPVYVHVGLITNASVNAGDWKNVPFTWGSTTPAALATPAGTNKWSYTINNVRTFFNVTDPAVVIKAVAILFRDAAGNRVQRNADLSVFNGNMYVPVYDNNLAVRFSLPPYQPYLPAIPETIAKQVGDNIAVTGIASQVSDMKLYLNGTVVQTATSVTTISASPALTATGNTEVVVEATASAITKKDTLRFFVSPAVTVAPLPAGVRDGINYASNNTDVTLVLYAPGKTRVAVIGEFPGNNWQEQSSFMMKRTPDGNYWWITITGLTPGTEYAFQYLVDGALKVGEPYAEKILDPNNDPGIPASTYPSLKAYPAGQTGIVSVLQTAAPAYAWSSATFTRPNKRGLVIYELLLRDFISAANWNTLRDTLTYLKRMGVNAIELMPVMEFDGNDSWGYSPGYFCAPDKFYGTKNALKQFIDTCHSKGMAVIFDIALNHASGTCPLAALYWNSATNQTAANNPWFNVTATHPYSVFHDFNHEALPTKYFFKRVTEYWLQEYRIDGFRFDLSKGFTQFNSGNDVNLWGQYDASRIAIWKSYYDTLQVKSPGSYVILEHFAANTEEIELSNYGMLLWGNHNKNFARAAQGLSTADNEGNTWNFEGGLYSVRGWTNPFLVTYMESHDEERLMYKCITEGNVGSSQNIKDTTVALKRVEMCAAFLMGMPGPKMIWQFGEVGYDYSINYCSDGSINSGCRTGKKPVRWNYQQEARRQQLYNAYTALLKLRAHPWYRDVFLANNVNITRNFTGPFKTMMIRSASDSSVLCIVGNFDINTQAGLVTFPIAGTWFEYMGGTTFNATGTAQSISLQPGEYRVYVNRNVSNIIVTPVIDINNPGNDLQVSAYPNPVSQSSVLELFVPARENVDVSLWNAQGQKIASIFAGILNRGKHTFALTSKTDNLPAGIYLLKVQSKGVTRSVKLLVK